MTPQGLAYLARYGFTLLIAAISLLLLRSAVRDLRGRSKTNLRPVRGRYLLALGGSGSNLYPVKQLPLFHTTILGRGHICDIRIHDEQVGLRHAVIYLYDGLWYVRPMSEKTAVLLNGVPVKDPVPLENKDLVRVGRSQLLYVDQEEAAAEAGGTLYADRSEDLLELLPQVHTGGAWFLTNLLMLGGSLLLLLLLTDGLSPLRRPYAAVFAVFYLLFNLYYFALPALIRPFERTAYLVFANLTFLGLLLQARLVAININYSSADITTDRLNDILSAMNSQSLALFLGFMLLPVIAVIVQRTRLLEMLVTACMVLSPLLLIITLILGAGKAEHGASLWLTIGPLSVQPTEFAKLTYLVALAGFFKNRPPLKQQIIFAGWAAAFFFLIMLLPDLGSAMILLPTTLVVFVVMTSEYLLTFLVMLASGAAGTLAYALFPYVRNRISGWTTLWDKVTANNEQIVFGLQAIGRGGLFGRGLGNGSPESVALSHSDMVFAVVCEEFGIIVGMCLVLLYIAFWLRGAKATMQVRDGFSSSLSLGIATLFFVEAAVVIGGTTGLIPLTGATLPFIASGGSSLLAKSMMVAVFLGLAGRHESV
ncbi:MAG: FtsW/RodA/SpoVE family cell cycle protein [Oscillospiraceae bacterium]|nr:FtsW/RodA/SpoVE family cell cycle protein [Oscillospiraceae bacterium]MDD4367363.1 FtsW/RodA/SpoVE family cell cycle protein [Oscillospiraceae bacterium]